jgi:hypothetical protein
VVRLFHVERATRFATLVRSFGLRVRVVRVFATLGFQDSSPKSDLNYRVPANSGLGNFGYGFGLPNLPNSFIDVETQVMRVAAAGLLQVPTAIAAEIHAPTAVATGI